MVTPAPGKQPAGLHQPMLWGTVTSPGPSSGGPGSGGLVTVRGGYGQTRAAFPVSAAIAGSVLG
jgi:hypothetical protein